MTTYYKSKLVDRNNPSGGFLGGGLADDPVYEAWMVETKFDGHTYGLYVKADVFAQVSKALSEAQSRISELEGAVAYRDGVIKHLREVR